jgi:hypothetical protein
MASDTERRMVTRDKIIYHHDAEDYGFQYGDLLSIETLSDLIQEVKNAGNGCGTNFRMKFLRDNDDHPASVLVYYDTEETDAEYNARTDKALQHRLYIEREAKALGIIQ